MEDHSFWRLAHEDPSRAAVIAPDGRVTCAGDLLRASNQVVHGLRALGLRRGDTVAMVLKNEYYAASEGGGTLATPEQWLARPGTVGKAWPISRIRVLRDDGSPDRKSDMIISGGVNIYPAEIEAALHGHPAVADVAVFGIPDDDWGEQIKAVIEPAQEAAPGTALAEEILVFLRGRLASFKCPKTIDFVDALPRDPNGKLSKRKLRDPYWPGKGRAIG